LRFVPASRAACTQVGTGGGIGATMDTGRGMATAWGATARTVTIIGTVAAAIEIRT